MDKVCVVDGMPAPIGQNGWMTKGGERALYDQQVVDAADMVLTEIAAWKITRKSEYLKKAKVWWRWFTGFNTKKVSLIDCKTGGCYDGITPWGVNLNQGAESIVCYLLAYLAMAGIEKEQIYFLHNKEKL